MKSLGKRLANRQANNHAINPEKILMKLSHWDPIENRSNAIPLGLWIFQLEPNRGSRQGTRNLQWLIHWLSSYLEFYPCAGNSAMAKGGQCGRLHCKEYGELQPTAHQCTIRIALPYAAPLTPRFQPRNNSVVWHSATLA